MSMSCPRGDDGGPYLAERQWEPFAKTILLSAIRGRIYLRAYSSSRLSLGEDGIAGFSDDGQRLCLALTLWNGRDSILKERLFGVANEEGNHGEDVKELYYYLDATPTHSYLKFLYKYPQTRFPYEQLYEENRRRGRHDPEFEILDTGVFDSDRYFDSFVEYAKAAPRDICYRVTVHNRGPDAAELHLLPTIWFRNTWSWGKESPRPFIALDGNGLKLCHPEWDEYRFWAERSNPHVEAHGSPTFLFTDNETNSPALFNSHSTGSRYFKDAFNDYLVHGNTRTVNRAGTGTKAAALYRFVVPPGQSVAIRCRLSHSADPPADPFSGFDELVAKRAQEADRFFTGVSQGIPDEDARRIQRQAIAGLIWTKQYYEYDVSLASRRLGNSAASRRARDRAELRLEHLKAGDVLDAGQVGIPVLLPGIPHSMPSRSPCSIRNPRRDNFCFCFANGTCIPTVNSLHTNGTSVTQTLQSTPGPSGVSFRSTVSIDTPFTAMQSRTGTSSSALSTNCSSTLPGG